MAPVYSWHEDGARVVRGRFETVADRIEPLSSRFTEFLHRGESEWVQHHFTGGPAFLKERGLAVGVVSEPVHADTVLRRLARTIGNERAASGVLLLPKIAATMFVPDEIIDGLIAIHITLDYAPRKNMLRDAERLLALHVSRMKELETASEADED